MARVPQNTADSAGAADRTVKSVPPQLVVHAASSLTAAQHLLRSSCFSYDQMGVLFTVVTSENTLESGLLQVRSRDTAIKETMHISEIKSFLLRYVSAADAS